MSGVRNLANAVANEPAFAKKLDGLYTKAELAEFVPQGDQKAAGMKTPKMNKGKGY